MLTKRQTLTGTTVEAKTSSESRELTLEITLNSASDKATGDRCGETNPHNSCIGSPMLSVQWENEDLNRILHTPQVRQLQIDQLTEESIDRQERRIDLSLLAY